MGISYKVLGIHHVTAIANSARRNYGFYTDVLGLRLVKKTVNFDDPTTYHLYYGNVIGEPGTILTFFPWEGIRRGRAGTGQASSIAFSIPQNATTFWLERFGNNDVTYNNPIERFDEEAIVFLDPDGLKLELVTHSHADERKAWTTESISKDHAIRGFYNVTLTVEGYERTARLLTDTLGYMLKESSVNRFRFINEHHKTANIIDLVCLPSGPRGSVAGGSVHHVAFRVAKEEDQLSLRQKLVELGFNVTPQIDRKYFKSIYFREPGGVMFEIATDPPGFTLDEEVEKLGRELKLPTWLEPQRKEIEGILPKLE
jgi:glyoxalase family protein